jgi:uncharacterized membrane protein YdjX (TVP38/TMEM64 family)
MIRRGALLRVAAAVAVIAALVVVGRQPGVREGLLAALGWIQGQGPAGAVVFVLVYVAACVFFIPGSLLGLGAGAIYGVGAGAALVSVGSTLGATAAFLVGRYLARDWVARRIAGNARFAAIDDAVGREGWKIVALTRLSPIFPFNLLNYAYGLTRVSLRDYVLASWAGMFPGTLLFVYLGSIAGDLAALGTSGAGSTGVRWAFTALGFAATAAVTIMVSRLARNALVKKV